MNIVLDILAYIFIEMIFWLILWIFALMLWSICLPLSMVVITPFFLISSIFKKEYTKELKSSYIKVFDFWMDLGTRIVP